MRKVLSLSPFEDNRGSRGIGVRGLAQGHSVTRTISLNHHAHYHPKMPSQTQSLISPINRKSQSCLSAPGVQVDGLDVLKYPKELETTEGHCLSHPLGPGRIKPHTPLLLLQKTRRELEIAEVQPAKQNQKDLTT